MIIISSTWWNQAPAELARAFESQPHMSLSQSQIWTQDLFLKNGGILKVETWQLFQAPEEL